MSTKVVIYVMSGAGRHFVTARETEQDDSGRFATKGEFFKLGWPIDGSPRQRAEVALALGLAVLEGAGV
jgi:hypothetical protein